MWSKKNNKVPRLLIRFWGLLAKPYIQPTLGNTMCKCHLNMEFRSSALSLHFRLSNTQHLHVVFTPSTSTLWDAIPTYFSFYSYVIDRSAAFACSGSKSDPHFRFSPHVFVISFSVVNLTVQQLKSAVQGKLLLYICLLWLGTAVHVRDSLSLDWASFRNDISLGYVDCKMCFW